MEKSHKTDKKPAIKVIGIDSFGANIVNRMIERDVDTIECIAVSTDYGALRESRAQTKILIGFGSFLKSQIDCFNEIDRYAYQKIQESLQGAALVIFVGDLSFSEPVSAAMIVAAAREMGIPIIGITCVRMLKEGRNLISQVNENAQKLCQQLVSLLVLSRNLLDRSIVMPLNSGILDMCRNMDVQVVDAVSGFIQLVSQGTKEKHAPHYQGLAAMGVGTASGAKRAGEAAARAASSPLLAGHNISRARVALVFIRSSAEITPVEIAAIRGQISDSIQKGGTVLTEVLADGKLGNELRVSVLFTGVGDTHDVVLSEPYLEDDADSHSGWDFRPEYSHADTYFDIFGV